MGIAAVGKGLSSSRDIQHQTWERYLMVFFYGEKVTSDTGAVNQTWQWTIPYS